MHDQPIKPGDRVRVDVEGQPVEGIVISDPWRDDEGEWTDVQDDNGTKFLVNLSTELIERRD